MSRDSEGGRKSVIVPKEAVFFFLRKILLALNLWGDDKFWVAKKGKMNI